MAIAPELLIVRLCDPCALTLGRARYLPDDTGRRVPPGAAPDYARSARAGAARCRRLSLRGAGGQSRPSTEDRRAMAGAVRPSLGRTPKRDLAELADDARAVLKARGRS